MKSIQEPMKSNASSRASGDDRRIVSVSEKRDFYAPVLVKQGVLKQLTNGQPVEDSF